MEADQFFQNTPAVLPIYLAFKNAITSRYPAVRFVIQKSQIKIVNRHGFAYVWLLVRQVRGRPETYLVVSFGLPYRLETARIIEAVEPYPGRWTHHTIIACLDDIDDQLMGWIDEACQFAQSK